MRVNIKSSQKRWTIALLRQLYGHRSGNLSLPDPPRSIALFAQERFGDIIMMSPLIRSLNKAYPDCEISIISVNRIADYLKYDTAIKRVLKTKHASSEVKNFLRTHEFDLLFNTKDHPSVIFLYLTGKIKAKQRIGINHPDHHGFFDHLLNPPTDGTTVQNYLSLLDHLRIPYTADDFIPYLPSGPVSAEIVQFTRTLAEHGAIAINLSASQTYKEWPAHKWSDFLTEIKQPAFIIAMPDKAKEKKELEHRFGQIIPSPSAKSIFDAAYLINHSRALLSPDTALVHIASCYNIPVVALYRQPLDLRIFPPFSKKQEILMAPDGSMAAIPVGKVVGAFRKLEASIQSGGLQ